MSVDDLNAAAMKLILHAGELPEKIYNWQCKIWMILMFVKII